MSTERKSQEAMACLDRRLGLTWERTRLERAPGFPACKVRLDRIVVSTSACSTELIADISGFICKKNHFIRAKDPERPPTYGRVAEFQGTASIRSLFILSKPRFRHLPKFRLTFLSADMRGLRAEDLVRVLEMLPEVKIEMLEVAWDFRRASAVDGAFIRAHGMFGKSRAYRVAEIRGWDAWGARKSPKFIRSYFKAEVDAHRLELQLNRRFLRDYKIRDIFYFSRLRKIIPKHFCFAEVDDGKVISWLRKNQFSARQTIEILTHVHEMKGNLLAQCGVLRRKANVKNAHRFLTLLPTNHLIRDALDRWLRDWPKQPNRILGGNREHKTLDRRGSGGISRVGSRDDLSPSIRETAAIRAD